MNSRTNSNARVRVHAKGKLRFAAGRAMPGRGVEWGAAGTHLVEAEEDEQRDGGAAAALPLVERHVAVRVEVHLLHHSRQDLHARTYYSTSSYSSPLVPSSRSFSPRSVRVRATARIASSSVHVHSLLSHPVPSCPVPTRLPLPVLSRAVPCRAVQSTGVQSHYFQLQSDSGNANAGETLLPCILLLFSTVLYDTYDTHQSS